MAETEVTTALMLYALEVLEAVEVHTGIPVAVAVAVATPAVQVGSITDPLEVVVVVVLTTTEPTK
jgi:hypothetical protein